MFLSLKWFWFDFDMLYFVSVSLKSIAFRFSGSWKGCTHIQCQCITTEVRGERLWRTAHAWPSNEEQMCSEKCTHTAYVQNHSEDWNITSSEECNQLHNSSLWNVRCILIYESALALSIRSSAFCWMYSSWNTAIR